MGAPIPPLRPPPLPPRPSPVRIVKEPDGGSLIVILGVLVFVLYLLARFLG